MDRIYRIRRINRMTAKRNTPVRGLDWFFKAASVIQKLSL
jgi:hypothetical protein